MTQTEMTIDVRQELDIEELAMAQLLTDDYCLKIITGTTQRSMSIKDMAFTYFIPFATCYKKVAQLEGAGLIKKEGKILTPNGKKHSVYRSCLKNFNAQYKGNMIILNVELEEKGSRTISLDLANGNLVVTV